MEPTIRFVLLLICVLFITITDHQVTAEEESNRFQNLGESEVKLLIPKSQQSSRSSSSSQISNDPPTALTVEFAIPKTETSVECQLVVNRWLLPADFEVKLIGRLNVTQQDLTNLAKKPCNYLGVGAFSSLPGKTGKCIFSLCNNDSSSGMVWLPGNEAFLSLSLYSDEKAGKTMAQVLTEKLPNSTSFSELLANAAQRSNATTSGARSSGTENDNFIRQLLLDQTPPEDWLHIRAVAFITAEAFNSDTFRSNAFTAVSSSLQTFNYVNMVWRQLKVNVYLMKTVIWADTNPPAEVMPDKSWDNTDKLLIHLAEAVERTLWTYSPNADIIVTIRNLLSTNSHQPVGTSWIGNICKGTGAATRGQGSVVAVRTRLNDYASSIGFLYAPIAHEIGHAMGMHHDTGGCHCPAPRSEQCVMHANLGSYPMQAWSDCSQRYLRTTIESLPPLCLRTIPDFEVSHGLVGEGTCGNGKIEGLEECDCGPGSIICSKCCDKALCRLLAGCSDTAHVRPEIKSTVCGNGILEPGEECDCGPEFASDWNFPSHIKNSVCPNPNCCNRQSCKLQSGRQCAQGPCCNTDTCSFKSAGTLCRGKKDGTCDIAESCSGNSGLCPADRYLITGTLCDTSVDGSCYKGRCVSRNAHCKFIMDGNHERMTPEKRRCYAYNTNLTVWGDARANNCGHERFMRNTRYDRVTLCRREDMECGSIMCSSYSQAKTQSYTVMMFNDWAGYKAHGDAKCFSVAGAMLPDYGLVPDGILCGEGNRKYCYKQKCIDVPRCPGRSPCDNFGQSVNWNT